MTTTPSLHTQLMHNKVRKKSSFLHHWLSVLFMGLDHVVASLWIGLVPVCCALAGWGQDAYAYCLFYATLWGLDVIVTVCGGLWAIAWGMNRWGERALLLRVYGMWLVILGGMVFVWNSKWAGGWWLYLAFGMRLLHGMLSRVGRHLAPVVIATFSLEKTGDVWTWEGALGAVSIIGSLVGWGLVAHSSSFFPLGHVSWIWMGLGCGIVGLVLWQLCCRYHPPLTSAPLHKESCSRGSGFVFTRELRPLWTMMWITAPTYLFYGMITRFLPSFFPLINNTITMQQADTHRFQSAVVDIVLLGALSLIWALCRPSVKRCKQGMLCVCVVGAIVFPLMCHLMACNTLPSGAWLLYGMCIVLGLLYTQWYWGYVRFFAKRHPEVATQGMLLGTLVLGKSAPAVGLWLFHKTKQPWAPGLWITIVCATAGYILWNSMVDTEDDTGDPPLKKNM